MLIKLDTLRDLLFESMQLSSSMARLWHLRDYQARWLRDGEGEVLEVAISELVPREGEDWRDVSQTSSKIKGICDDWSSGYRHPTPDGMRLNDERIQARDGRFRIAAAIVKGLTKVPIVVGVR
jgi:uncharacterized damage-inducible protein DinB